MWTSELLAELFEKAEKLKIRVKKYMIAHLNVQTQTKDIQVVKVCTNRLSGFSFVEQL